MQKLHKAEIGDYIVKWLYDEPEVVEMLDAVSIYSGSAVSVIANSGYGDLVLRTQTGKFAIDADLLYGVTV